MLEKIKSLFDYRLLPQLVNEGSNGEGNVKLIESLYNLQIAIYKLDHHLETNWNITASDIEPFWHEINKILKNEFNISEEELTQYISDILTYQKHELNLRSADLPTALDPFYFYYYKSCDVKLLRKLIYRVYPKLFQKYKLQNWKAFDLITELNDDIEDIFEDLDSINGNAVLIKAQKSGIAQAYKYANDLITEINSINTGKHQIINPIIIKATTKRIKETKLLLINVISKLEANPTILEQSKLINLLLLKV